MQVPPAQNCNSAERIVVIRNEEGLHMRPAMQFIDCANGFESQITIHKGDQRANGKSIAELTMLAAGKGTQLRICAVGNDAAQAIEALAEIIENEITKNTD